LGKTMGKIVKWCENDGKMRKWDFFHLET
jgi:hypothetical protein